jgi:DNA-binding MarR family transcriptional regulator
MTDDNDQWQTTARALNSGAIHLLRGMREIDRIAGLTPARLSALSVLVFGGSMSLGRLARAEGVAGPTMTRIVDGLVELGLARRESHPENGRITMISASDTGTRLMLDAAQRRIDAIAAALEQLPTEKRDALAAAAPLLDELAALVRGNT